MHSGGRVGLVVIGLAGLWTACARTSRPPSHATPATVAPSEPARDLPVLFSVEAPFTNADAIGMSAAVRPMLEFDESVHVVEPVSCRPATCTDGIDARAEALVLTGSSDMADIIELCRRAGRWF